MGRVKLAWSCDEKNRNKCRNAHGCHCREITSLVLQCDDREKTVGIALRMIARLEAQIKVSPHGR